MDELQKYGLVPEIVDKINSNTPLKFENKSNTEIRMCCECKYYESYRDACFGDELEPDDCGFCRGSEEKNNHTTSESEACKYFSCL